MRLIEAKIYPMAIGVSLSESWLNCSLEQADATSWMAFYCMCLSFISYFLGIIMLKISIELALYVDSSYEDLASKFFEHFILIADAANNKEKQGLW